MRNRPVAAAAAAIVLTAGVVAGCGGSSATVTKTVTTDSLPATTTAPPATTASTAPAPPATAGVTVGEERLPPADALANLREGSPEVIDDAARFVDALYQAGDPAKPAATARLQAAGYAGGILRDQAGTDPSTTIALFRTYALALADEAAARAEVSAAVQEVRDSSTAPTTDLSLADIPGAEGLHVEVDQQGVTGAVTFVTFPAGRYVYGLQGVSTDDATLPEDEIIGAARDLYEKVTAAP